LYATNDVRGISGWRAICKHIMEKHKKENDDNQIPPLFGDLTGYQFRLNEYNKAMAAGNHSLPKPKIKYVQVTNLNFTTDTSDDEVEDKVSDEVTDEVLDDGDENMEENESCDNSKSSIDDGTGEEDNDTDSDNDGEEMDEDDEGDDANVEDE
jgi:hypothetical protein